MNPLVVAFVGAGWMGSVQLKRLAEREDVRVAYLVETNVERARELLNTLRLHSTLATADFEDAIRDPAVEAVWLVSPNSFHGPQSIAAMKAGKHVFCEKPAATKYEEFLEQLRLERANPRLITYVDYILYFDAFEERLREMIAANAFGTVGQIQVNYRHPVNIAGEKTWKLRKQVMGDAIGMGINHAISVMVFAMQSQAKPVSVFGTSMPAQVRDFEADPIWNILVRFDNGATGFCFGNIDSSNGYDAFHSISGSEGELIFDSRLDRAQKIRMWSKTHTNGAWIHPLDAERCAAEGVNAWPSNTTTPDSGNVIEHQTGACVAHFIDAVKSGRRSPLSFGNSRIVAEIGWAARMSAGLRQEILLPLNEDQARIYFDNEHANVVQGHR